MEIDVTGIARSFDHQTRAYAEYRVFSSLARFTGLVRAAAITITPSGGDAVRCEIAVLTHAGPVRRVVARGSHPAQAVDRAANRAAALATRLEVLVSS